MNKKNNKNCETIIIDNNGISVSKSVSEKEKTAD